MKQWQQEFDHGRHRWCKKERPEEEEEGRLKDEWFSYYYSTNYVLLQYIQYYTISCQAIGRITTAMTSHLKGLDDFSGRSSPGGCHARLLGDQINSSHEQLLNELLTGGQTRQGHVNRTTCIYWSIRALEHWNVSNSINMVKLLDQNND